jgi:hypothetical protein
VTPVKIFNGLDEFVAAEGTELGPTEWLEIGQNRVSRHSPPELETPQRLLLLRFGALVEDRADPPEPFVLRCRTWRSAYGICGIAQVR